MGFQYEKVFVHKGIGFICPPAWLTAHPFVRQRIRPLHDYGITMILNNVPCAFSAIYINK